MLSQTKPINPTEPTTTFPPKEIRNRYRRNSRFLEGSEHASDQFATTNSHLISVLTEMDKYAQKGDLANNKNPRFGKPCTSNASVESFTSSSTTGTFGARPNSNSTSKLGKQRISFVQASSTGHYSIMGSETHHRDIHGALNDVKKSIKGKFQSLKMNKSKKLQSTC
ncbi:hypothetical protein OnM2_079021 [Erysiphe neolycopersici]|uniref:Uncharacterized protein n=1 Tax=Erysiphe neolycopersici TaxID=212602 RepID=A0A420HGX2_9PEZI|nr:hypothetical protein OnM2_079021 [Erysiphe neolycopersici]